MNVLAALLHLEPGRLQQEHERAGAAIHDGHFGRGQIDVGVVDAETGERGHEVLDGRDAHAVLLEARGEARVADRVRLSLDLHRVGEVDAAENDAGIGRGRT